MNRAGMNFASAALPAALLLAISTAANAGAVRAAGADVLVAGSAVFRGGPAAYAANIAGIRAAAG